MTNIDGKEVLIFDSHVMSLPYTVHRKKYVDGMLLGFC